MPTHVGKECVTVLDLCLSEPTATWQDVSWLVAFGIDRTDISSSYIISLGNWGVVNL